MEILNIKRGKEVLPIIYTGVNIIKEIKLKGGNFFEFYMLESIARLPYRPGLFLDVGANTGNHTVFFSRYCNADEVWAYEPVKSTFEVLKANVTAHAKRPVKLFNCAVGAEKGKVNFSDGENSAINKIIPGIGEVTMETLNIDAKVGLIKIDVEGHEVEVLKGAQKMLNRDKPELFVENFGKPEDLLPLLPEGYKVVNRYNNAPTYHYSFG
jgi:FkbM family methyltransferase